MRTTIRIDDTLMLELKTRASKERVSLTRLINRLIRDALATSRKKRTRAPYREKPFHLGDALFDARKALAAAAAIEDEETLRKLALRK